MALRWSRHRAHQLQPAEQRHDRQHDRAGNVGRGRQKLAAIHQQAEANKTTFEWTNCGLCVDERGANEALPFVKRGSPADFLNWANSSDNTLVIATK